MKNVALMLVFFGFSFSSIPLVSACPPTVYELIKSSFKSCVLEDGILKITFTNGIILYTNVEHPSLVKKDFPESIKSAVDELEESKAIEPLREESREFYKDMLRTVLQHTADDHAVNYALRNLMKEYNDRSTPEQTEVLDFLVSLPPQRLVLTTLAKVLDNIFPFNMGVGGNERKMAYTRYLIDTVQILPRFPVSEFNTIVFSANKERGLSYQGQFDDSFFSNMATLAYRLNIEGQTAMFNELITELQLRGLRTQWTINN